MSRCAGVERVLCKAILRAIPGNREVFDAQWNGKEIIVKVFSKRLGAKIKLMREWGGLVKLRQRGVNAPEPLFFGKTEGGDLAIAIEKVAGAQTLSAIFNKAAGKKERAGLLKNACKELAVQHEKGIFQKDLHLGNFLVTDEGICSIDPAQMLFSSRPLGGRTSISQLALLTSNFHGDETDSVLNVWKEYFNLRKWRLGESEQRLLWEQTAAHRRNWLKHAMKKCLRTSKRFLRVSEGESVAVFDREFIEGNEPADFLQSIDERAEKGEVLKLGRTSCVWRLRWNGKDVVVKRYNHKGLIHSLRHTLKGSRARRSWLNGQRLRCLSISTPRPVAYIESRKWGVVWMSYLVTEYVEGQNLYHFLRDEKVGEERRSDMVRQVLEMIENLYKNGITHRDLKPTNILFTNAGPVLTDLDAMKAHKLRWIGGWKGHKYLERFRQGVREKGV